MREISILEAVLTILKEWNLFTRPRRANLLRLCKKKYADLEGDHRDLLSILEELDSFVLEELKNDERIYNSDVRDRFDAMDRRRVLSRQARLARYTEAKLYIEEETVNRYGLIRAIPKPIKDAVTSFMQSYADYFQSFGATRYSHGVGVMFEQFRNAFDHAEPGKGPYLSSEYLHHMRRQITEVRESLELSWIRVSRDYYRLYYVFADHGVSVGEQD